jgi:hypothetical protein
MRCLLFVAAFVPLFILLAPPSAAHEKEDGDKAKRIAEIEKEIAELQARIGKLAAELGMLRPAPKPAAQPRQRGDTVLHATIVKLIQSKNQTTGFYLDATPPEGIMIYLRKDTEIMFSDKAKAGVADLKAGQAVAVRIDRSALAAKGEPPRAYAYVVVISKEMDKGKDDSR